MNFFCKIKSRIRNNCSAIIFYFLTLFLCAAFGAIANFLDKSEIKKSLEISVPVNNEQTNEITTLLAQDKNDLKTKYENMTEKEKSSLKSQYQELIAANKDLQKQAEQYLAQEKKN